MRAPELFKRNALPFAAGIGTGTYLLFGAPQDQMGIATALAPVAAAAVLFTPGGHRTHGLPGADDGAIRIDGGVLAEVSSPHSL